MCIKGKKLNILIKLISFKLLLNSYIEKRVIWPLQQLLETFQGLTRLITKRQDKQIDFSATAQWMEKKSRPYENKISMFKIFKHLMNKQILLDPLLKFLNKTSLANTRKYPLGRCTY